MCELLLRSLIRWGRMYVAVVTTSVVPRVSMYVAVVFTNIEIARMGTEVDRLCSDTGDL